MNHQPFEEWLLNDVTLSAEQKHELERHTRICAYCAALVKTDKVLRTVRMASPSSGFVSRFEMRLAVQKVADRKRRFFGLLFFGLVGSMLLAWLAAPYLSGLLTSPAEWIAALMSWVVFIVTTLLASFQAGAVIFDVLSGFLSPFTWMVMISGAVGASLFWSVSIWRFARRDVPQGV